MNHSPSKTKVFQSTDYKIFKKVDGNRPLNKKKIERIIKEIESGNDILDEVPILVRESNNHLDVLEGQHRLAIAEKLKRPVHYIVHREKMSLHDVAKVNSNTEKWKDADFIHAYKTAGNSHYKKLEDFKKTYGMATGVCLVLLTHGTTRKDHGAGLILKQQFETGQFEIKLYKEAVQVAEICKNFSSFSGWNTRSFISAICAIIEANKCEFDVLLKKFNRDTSRLRTRSSWKEYLTNLEEIYNIDNSKRRVIF